MRNNGHDKKVLRTARAIMDEYDLSRSMFNHFVRLGLPVRVEKGSFWGHKDNIDEWFRRFTYCTSDEPPEEVE
jgi:hypothetical protein